MARRLVERGVRMVQVFYGSGSKWDDHGNIDGHRGAKSSDRAVAGLLRDLKARDCSTIPSCCGAVSSAARRCPKERVVAIPITMASALAGRGARRHGVWSHG